MLQEIFLILENKNFIKSPYLNFFMKIQKRFFSILFLFIILNSFLISASEISEGLKGVWENSKIEIKSFFKASWIFIKEKFSLLGKLVGIAWKPFDKKIDWVKGSRNFEGNEVHLFSEGFWTFQYFGSYLVFSLVVFILAILLDFILFRIIRSGSISLPTVFSKKQRFKLFLKSKKSSLIFLVLYPLLMGVPYINRFLQIITLEVLAINEVFWWFWRSLIVALVLGFGSLFLERYKKYRERKKITKEEYERVFQTEAVKAITGT